MSSPARSVSSDDEEAKELAELKAKHEAELREAVERKAIRDRECQERREREKREKKEREEREAREEMTRRIREVGKAVAGVARGLAETEQQQVEREQEALCWMRTAERPTEIEVEARQIAETTGRLRGFYSTAAERARALIEKKARAKTEKLRAALTRVQEAADRGEEVGGSEDESDGPSGVCMGTGFLLKNSCIMPYEKTYAIKSLFIKILH